MRCLDRASASEQPAGPTEQGAGKGPTAARKEWRHARKNRPCILLPGLVLYNWGINQLVPSAKFPIFADMATDTPSATYLDQLNDVQRQAVTAINGPVLVVAGPGWENAGADV